MVIALLALFVALDGPATAARLIDGRSIKRNSITNRQIRNHTLGTLDLSAQAFQTLRTTPRDSITAAQLRAKAVAPARSPTGGGHERAGPEGRGRHEARRRQRRPAQLGAAR